MLVDCGMKKYGDHVIFSILSTLEESYSIFFWNHTMYPIFLSNVRKECHAKDTCNWVIMRNIDLCLTEKHFHERI